MKLTCPKCHKERDVYQSRNGNNAICRPCFLSKSATVVAVCSNCGESRKIRPTKQCQYPAGLCRKCYDALRIARRRAVTCPRCGKVRWKRPCELPHYQTGRCNNCKFDYDPQIPDRYEAGYVVGAVLGDGYLSAENVQNRVAKSYRVRLDVKSEPFARRFALALETCSDHKPWIGECDRSYKANPAIGMRAGTTHRYRVVFSDREWYEKLLPIKREKKYYLLADFGLEFTSGFVQGFLDAEGYVFNDPLGKKSYIDFANKDHALLENVEAALNRMGLHRTRIYGPYQRGVYHLRLKDSTLQKTA